MVEKQSVLPKLITLLKSIFKKTDSNKLTNSKQDNSLNLLSYKKQITNNFVLQITKDKPNKIADATAIINLNTISLAEKEKIKEIILAEYETGNLITDKDTDILLISLTEYYNNPDPEDKKIIHFFKDILNPNDLLALKSAIYLRANFKKHKYNEVKLIKEDIKSTFGYRGSQISNLCSAGYFDDFLKNLYNSDKDKFNSLLELIVNNELITVFVNQNMSIKQIKTEIIDKISQTKRYGFDTVYVHGLGFNNIENIKKCILENKDSFKVDPQNIFVNKEYHIYMVKILL